MAKCNKKHFIKFGRLLKPVSCYYIAGICVVEPIHQGTMEMFLRSTFPFNHGPTYEESKLTHSTLVPNNIRFANVSV